MTAVVQLRPGDLVINGGMSAVFVASTQHPLWPHLALVIWRMPGQPEQWSHDALRWYQEVGEVQPADDAERTRRLRAVLLERATGVKATMWQGLEEQYRADLAAGRTDTTRDTAVPLLVWDNGRPGDDDPDPVTLLPGQVHTFSDHFYSVGIPKEQQ